jgi:hypothetical protein
MVLTVEVVRRGRVHAAWPHIGTAEAASDRSPAAARVEGGGGTAAAGEEGEKTKNAAYTSWA